MDFGVFLQQQRLEPNTIYEYQGAVLRFQEWYEQTYHKKLVVEEMDPKVPLDYQIYLRDEKRLVPRTINKNLAGIRKWLEMHRRADRWVHDLQLPDIKQQKKSRSPQWLDPQVVTPILYGVEQEPNEFLRARDRCLIYFELYRGIRVGENMLLQMDDVILTQGRQRIIIRKGKGGKYDEIDISGSRRLLRAIHEWIDIRAQSKHASSNYFFITFRSGKITNGAIEKMVKRIRERSHVYFRTHQLRHTFIHDVEQEKGLRVAHELARHSDIKTTLEYTQPTDSEINAAYRVVESKY